MSYFRRAVNLDDENLQNGDYCSVSLEGRSDNMGEFTSINGVVVAYQDKIFFLSNENGFDGQNIPQEMKEEARCEYSWRVGNIEYRTFRFALQRCFDAEFRDIKQSVNRTYLNTTHLRNGEYCPVIFRHPRIIAEDRGMLVVYEHNVYLLNNNLDFDGARCPLSMLEFGRFANSWLVSSIRDESILDVQMHTQFRFTEIDDETPVVDAPQQSTQPQGETSEELMSKNYEREVIFSDMHSYHSHHGQRVNLPLKRYTHRIGVELEVEFASSLKKNNFTEIKTNWFYCERDGSLGSNGCEIITIPLHPNDAKNKEFWKPLCDTLVSLGAKSWDTSTCGCHVHIGREILGKDDDEKSQTLGKLLYFYHEFLKDTLGNCKIYGRNSGYHDTICKTEVSTAVKTLGSGVLKDKEVRTKLDKSMKDRSQTTRYFDINVMNSATIEFRKGKGSLNPERIAMIVEWSELIVSYAKFTHWKNISMETFKTFIKMKSGLNEMTTKFIEDYFA